MKDFDRLCLDAIESVDKSAMYQILADFSHQYREATDLAEEFAVDPSFGDVSNVVISGMGGSAIGGDLLRSLYSESCPVPIVINRNYSIPKFVGKDTLFISASYSGNTEETVSSLEEAIKQDAKAMSVSGGGRLEAISKAEGIPHFSIQKRGIQPRCAFGYLFVPMLMILSKLNLIPDQKSNLQETVDLISEASKELEISVEVKDNFAKQLAEKFYDHLPVIYASQNYLDVVAMRWKGQVNENSKALAFYNVIPEMNHNEIVGWGIPDDLTRRCVVVMLINDDDYYKINKRTDITGSLIADTGTEVVAVRAKGNSPLAKALYLIYVGDMVSYYLAIINDIDPTPVERIALLKSKLGD